MNITILNVSIETKPTKTGKNYQVADVAFKNNTFQGKVEGKKVLSFGAQAEAFKTLSTAQPGDSFEVTVTKNDQGYNDWTAMQKSGAVAGGVGVPAVAGAGKAAGPVARSPYETPEERAKRQVYIVRQSSVSNAVATLVAGAKSAPSAESVINLAKQYEAYVFGVPGLTGFEDIPDLDPSFNTEPQIG